ncbi:hypothetical protein FRB94_007679 [Tulasnella sp. JGI-2019a]|nr:hypothetical protein FRB94_007679 [Tulasnella sp. JGI-2019a]
MSRRNAPGLNAILLVVLAGLLTTAYYRAVVLQLDSGHLPLQSSWSTLTGWKSLPSQAANLPPSPQRGRIPNHRFVKPPALATKEVELPNLYPDDDIYGDRPDFVATAPHTPESPQALPSSSSQSSDSIRHSLPQPAPADPRPLTKLVRNAPGWTIMENLYISNGTLFIITSEPNDWPESHFIINVALPLEGGVEEEKKREPTPHTISLITPSEAEALWGDRIWGVEDWTFMINDAPQHLNHYYHFVAETFFGLWMMFASMDPNINVRGNTILPAPARVMFPHHEDKEWRDYSKFNHWVLHGVFPALSTESAQDWEGRTSMTTSTAKAFRFTNVVLADRSASMRGAICPGKTNRIASEAWEVVKDINSQWWWEPVRRSALRFAGVDRAVMDLPVMWDGVWTGGRDVAADTRALSLALEAMPIVISYIVRSSTRRSLVAEDHRNLVQSLRQLCDVKGWELNIVHAEQLSREEQVQLAAKTTVMLGVHGNGLTHLVWMPVTPLSTVIEIFVPGGFATDYEWTARTLGMRHFAVWNDTWHTYPNAPNVDYPEGFQGDQIPVHGPSIARLVEDRIEGRL